MTYNFHVVVKLNYPIFLVLIFLRAAGCHVDLENSCVLFNNGSTVLPLQTSDSSMSLLKSSDHVSLPPRTEALISVRLANKAARRFDSKYVIIELCITTMQRGF